jgi:uncharacterized protein (DUF1330 family)
MSVYFVAEIQQIKDKETYSKYAEVASGIVKKYGGKYHVRGGKAACFFGDWEPGRLIIVEFDSAEQLRKCFKSPEYLEIAPLREKATIGRAVVVEGVE